MKDSAASLQAELDETDLAIAHALQIAPRASWTAISEVLGLSAVTVARRWGRISDRGLAWVTATGSPGLWRSLCNAFIDVDCEPSARHAVALALARDPRTKSVMELASGRDIHVNAVTRDLPGLSRFILERVSRLPGVVRVNTQITTRILVAGSDWRLDALPRAERTLLQAVADETAPRQAVPGALDGPERELLLALAPDGRLPVSDLAERTGTSQTAARRRLARLERTGAVAFRCEIAQHITGWPVTSLMWARVAVPRRRQICEQLSRMPDVRLLTATSGETNLLFSTWLHSVDSAHDLEDRIGAQCPGLEIVDHGIVLRTVKRQGWILDELGRCQESAPIDPWYDGDIALPETGRPAGAG
ncbi:MULTISPECIES: Lrp/AsnC family transcriptional regulator [unclassified Streptomyces]|uniref:Lrp/AsnC family transcriptional regulator n=1 Tax=unclassified Streptomyces TaxID=2593676 RepID=UPI002E75A38D|nr:Lrp/AsnC family transcriptional regulator [Streptomyces sp. JV176]MEE1799437.1 Lrp/AsnC family transcriptional regulator [Streptomyces sp. JV176]